MPRRVSTRRKTLVAANVRGTARVTVVTMAVALAVVIAPAADASTPNPVSVTIAGDLQSELGCAGDWDPSCGATHLTYDPADDVWQQAFSVPSGDYSYKAALNDTWDESYGLNAVPGGTNIPLSIPRRDGRRRCSGIGERGPRSMRG